MILPDSKSIFWVVVNKPRAVLTTMADEKDRDTLSSIVPKVMIRLSSLFLYAAESNSCMVKNAVHGDICLIKLLR